MSAARTNLAAATVLAEKATAARMESAKVHAEWPRITVVTPVYNGERYIEETIRSIVDQGYPNLEYIIVNDGSTDGTVDIIRQYEPYLAHSSTQTNQGMYAALNAGFAQSTGEIMGWVNANDKLHTKALFVVGSVFSAFPEVEWITGRPTVFDNTGMTVMVQDLPHWSRARVLAGAYRYIQQESTFWRRGLWAKSGGHLSGAHGAAGDFELWIRFFRHAKLYPVDALIGGWRFHAGSASHQDQSGYDRYCEQVLRAERQLLSGLPLALCWSTDLLRRADRIVRHVPKLRFFWRRMIMETVNRSLYGHAGPDWPRVIEYRYPENQWSFRA